MTMQLCENASKKPSIPILRAGEWLHLAAAPTFSIMAGITGLLDGGTNDVLCSAARGGSPLGGMAAMYVLMALFHSAPWLKLISRG